MIIEEIDALIEVVLSSYQGKFSSQDADVHHAKVIEIYAEILNGSVQVQMTELAATIAVLYWKLAQERGLITDRVDA